MFDISVPQLTAMTDQLSKQLQVMFSGYTAACLAHLSGSTMTPQSVLVSYPATLPCTPR